MAIAQLIFSAVKVVVLPKREIEDEAFLFGPYCLIPSRRLLLAVEERIELGGRAFDALSLLVRHNGEILSQGEILDHVWRPLTVDETNLRAQLSHVRRALCQGDDGMTYIKNVRGRGYVFVAPVRRIATSELQVSLVSRPGRGSSH